jgi:hypothetical protein
MKKHDLRLETAQKSKKQEVGTVKEAVDDLINVLSLKDKFNQISTITAWKQIMGESVARRTQKIFIDDHKMFIKIESASLKNELMMAKSRILLQLNQITNEGVLDDLVFL